MKKVVLTSAAALGYYSPVVGIPAAGFCSPNCTGGRTATSSFGGFFASITRLCSLWAGRVGSRKARRVLYLGLQTHTVPLIFAFCSAWAGNFSILRTGVMP